MSPSLAPAWAAVPARGLLGQLTSQPLPGLRADVATLIMQGASGGGLDLAVSADRVSSGKRGALDLAVEVSGESLLAGGSVGQGVADLEVEFYVYVVDSRSAVVAHLARRVNVSLDDWGERMGTGGLRFREALEVPSGELSVRSLILVPASRRFGMVVSDLEDPQGTGLLGRPRSSRACGEWLPVVGAGEAAPGVVNGVRSLWKPGDRVEIVLPLLGDPPPSLESVFGTIRRSEQEAVRIPVVVLPATGSEAESEAVMLALDVPELEQGIYSFRVHSGDHASPASEVWVLPASGTRADLSTSGSPVCSWPAVISEARLALAGVASTEGIGSPQQGALRRRARGEYAEILRSFGAGDDLEAAVTRLVEWEVASTAENVPKLLPVVAGAQVALVRELVAIDRESLLPVFELHRRAYQVHFERRNFGLAGHSRKLAASVAEIWLATVDPDQGAGWAADALVGLGETADRHRMFAASQSLLEWAAEVAPDHRAARLLLSMLYEKLGEYDTAVRHLKKLVAVAPADSEGWLRLATLQLRLGESKACTRSLRRVLGQRPQPWILSLAYQTRVQELFADERFAEGLRALDEAALLLPADPALTLARVYGLDRIGRGREAARVLEGLRPAGEGSISPRLRYEGSGTDVTSIVEARLRRNLVVRQPLLARAVESALKGTA